MRLTDIFISSDAASDRALKMPMTMGRGFGHRYTKRTKVVGGKFYRLHATRGWKCQGRAA